MKNSISCRPPYASLHIEDQYDATCVTKTDNYIAIARLWPAISCVLLTVKCGYNEYGRS